MKATLSHLPRLLMAILLGFACAWGGARGTLANQAFTDPQSVLIAAGPFIAVSDQAEREAAYVLDEAAYGHNRTRKSGWYDRERQRATLHLPAYEIIRTSITNAQYAAFLRETGHPAPNVDEATWKGYRLIHPFARTRRHAWHDQQPPVGRDAHPVPWGDRFNLAHLNSHDAGPFDTLPVGSFPDGASPFGLLDAAGQVFEWTSSPGNPGRFLVKGGSWDDKGCGVCRPAARHARPAGIKHILIGFRLVSARQ